MADDIRELIRRGWTRAEIHRRIGGKETCQISLLDKLTGGLRKTAPPEVAARIHRLLDRPAPPPIKRHDRVSALEVARDIHALQEQGWTIHQIRNALPSDARLGKATLSKIANAGTPKAHGIESVKPEVAAAIRRLREAQNQGDLEGIISFNAAQSRDNN